MKKIIISLLLMMTIASCKKKGCTDPTALNYNPEAEVSNGLCEYENDNYTLVGLIESDRTLTADHIWTLSGRVAVTNGATLTIEPGTIIKAEAGSGGAASSLIIAQGAKIIADGTATNPIIFTAESDNIQLGELSGTNLDINVNGLWGGLMILGNAPISAITSPFQIEGIPASDPNGLYGGNDPADNSGRLRYVSIRHGGTSIGAGNEINGLTLGGVGSETIIENIEIVANTDDGLECFGGTANVSNLLVLAVGDDCLDLDQGYSGTINNSVIIPGLSTDHSLELDGGEGNTNPSFTITNCELDNTLIWPWPSYVHFRSQANGNVSLFGDFDIEADAGTNVVVDTLSGVGFDRNIFTWTYYGQHL